LDDAPEHEGTLVHGTCVSLGRTGALLRGPSGSGKSDLALRFIYLARRGPAAIEAPLLVADDQVLVHRLEDKLVARAPSSIRGLLEVRGIGIVEVKPAPESLLSVIVDLVAPGDVERMPQTQETELILGVEVSVVRLAPFENSAPIKLAAAIARVRKG
jgi:serine kinase of HPr protein (carbohydrate metabolism regulator)